MHRLFLALVAAVAIASTASAEPKKVTPDREWSAVISDNDLAKKAPESGIITDAKTFEAVWKAWRKDEKTPEVDFKKNIVVVTLALGGPNKPRCSATLDEKGDLKILAISTLIGGDGFGYAMGIYPREGVKTVNGKEVK
jgi:hypothetical protein